MPETVLVTGARGTLGRPLVARLRSGGWNVRQAGRHGPVRLDLATGEGLAEAVQGASVIVHAASNPLQNTWKTDVDGTRALVEQARQVGVRHFIYVGIVGTERGQAFPYYRVKLAAEEAVMAGGVPWSIQRATQFFELLPDQFFPRLTRLGVLWIFAGLRLQPVEVTDVADRLAVVAGREPGGQLPDFGGPEILTMEQMAHSWMQAAGVRRPVVALPPIVRFARQVASGALLCPDHRAGTLTWAEWLRRRYGPSPAAG